ncbi:hypothetical protein CDD80_1108 [Ophiocordyceps camponoti-rufipedis]|uniref:Uncharacterized protein n=1 Tax=Ophiocordyceps camponoti-rufipedis TaxID=2004952 RepID=A0A2C5YBT2_9HYPO|nr:hypothetical protein CDD80_1108 [Ophiocordyceps camponoti-rufipedis]
MLRIRRGFGAGADPVGREMGFVSRSLPLFPFRPPIAQSIAAHGSEGGRVHLAEPAAGEAGRERAAHNGDADSDSDAARCSEARIRCHAAAPDSDDDGDGPEREAAGAFGVDVESD